MSPQVRLFAISATDPLRFRLTIICVAALGSTPGDEGEAGDAGDAGDEPAEEDPEEDMVQ